MKNDHLSICNDAVFKAVFTKNTAESRAALKSLLSAFLQRELYVLDVTPNEPAINDLRDRQIRYDISVRFNDGEQANVEMTLNPKHYEGLRFEYYTARLFLNQDIRGRSYRDLKPAYHLSFLYENLYADKEWLHRFIYYDPELKIKMGGRTEIITVELKKLKEKNKKTVEELDNREGWGLFIMMEGQNVELMQQLVKKDDGIAAAAQTMRGFTKTELEYFAETARIKYELDAREELLDMKDDARAEGLAEGRAEEKKDMARKLKAIGLPLDQIIEVSGLSAEAVERL